MAEKVGADYRTSSERILHFLNGGILPRFEPFRAEVFGGHAAVLLPPREEVLTEELLALAKRVAESLPEEVLKFLVPQERLVRSRSELVAQTKDLVTALLAFAHGEIVYSDDDGGVTILAGSRGGDGKYVDIPAVMRLYVTQHREEYEVGRYDGEGSPWYIRKKKKRSAGLG